MSDRESELDIRHSPRSDNSGEIKAIITKILANPDGETLTGW